MDQEFLESDVIFSDLHDDGEDGSSSGTSPRMRHTSSYGPFRTKASNQHKKKKYATATSTSLPVKVPAGKRMLWARYGGGEDEDREDEPLEEEWYDEEIVPPHIIIGRRVAGKIAFSVLTGNGRTLKGRHLSQLRNSILRMTGFLES